MNKPRKSPPARSRRALAFAAAALSIPAAAAVLPVACKGSGVDVTLTDEAGLRKSAAFVELLVYPVACPSLEVLSRGVEGNPKVRRVAAASGDPPEIGDLPTGSYGVAAVLRDADCAIVASGCADADFGDVRKVTIPLGAVTPPQGACTGGATCVDARCTGGSDAGAKDGGVNDAGPHDGGTPDASAHDAAAPDASADGGVGACKLSVLASAALPGLIDATGGTVTGPAVLATSSGFLVAYREASHDGAASTAALIALADDGKASLPSRQALPTCAGPGATDGVALAEAADGSGLLVVSRPACAPGNAGVALLSFDPTHALGPAAASIDLGASVSVPRAHGLVARKTGFDAALLVDGTAVIAAIGAGSIAKTSLFEGGATSTFVSLALAPKERVTLADRASGGAVQTVLTMAPLDAQPVGDAGPPLPLVEVRPPAAWGSVVAWAGPSADRAAAISIEPSGAVAWSAIEWGGVARGAGSIAPGDGAAFAGGDVAVLDERVIAAIGESGAIRLQRLVGAQGDALAAEGAPIGLAGAGLPPLDSFDGSRVAIAAARGRVLVAWVDKGTLGPGEPTGGWALLSCGE